MPIYLFNSVLLDTRLSNSLFLVFSLQLRNIQSVIRLTKENIDALNAQFAGFQHPPLMYIAVSTIQFFLVPPLTLSLLKDHLSSKVE